MQANTARLDENAQHVILSDSVQWITESLFWKPHTHSEWTQKTNASSLGFFWSFFSHRPKCL